MGMPGVREPAIHDSPRQRSAVANGSKLFVEPTDKRTAIYRRFSGLVAELCDHLGGNVTPTQMQLVRRAATLSVWCEAIEAKLAGGEDVSAEMPAYTTASNSLGRLLKEIGYRRELKDVTPSFDELIRRPSK